jgi:PAS domain S-box-containing protein
MDVLNFPITPDVDESVEATERCFGGYHRCRLQPPYQLDYVSDSLCKLLGYSAQELYDMSLDEGPPQEHGRSLVYPPDQPVVLRYLKELSQKEETRAVRLRLVKKDGNIVYVNDTISSHRGDDGVMYGYAVVAELTQRQRELFSSQPMPSVVPYGYLVCTDEESPQITSVNDQMLDYLRIPRSSGERMKQHDILFLIPNEERPAFLRYLEEARKSDTAVSLEHQFFRSDGSRLPLMGWVNQVVNHDGSTGFAFVYLLTDYKHHTHDTLYESSYFYALQSAYSVILEHDLSSGTVSCVHGKDLLGAIYDTTMTIDSGRRFWLDNFVVAEDRETLETYLKQLDNAPLQLDGQHPTMTEFHVNWTENRHFFFRCVAVQLDPFRVLLCLQDIGTHPQPTVEAPPPETKAADQPEEKQIFARTFGYFDLFVNGTPIVFTSSKEKELLALLIDRNGGTLTTDQAITYLWEDEPVDEHLYARYRKLAMGLKKTLAKYGIEHILINHGGVRSIDTTALLCDYYELLKGNEHYIKSFHNAYMTDYSWADDTLATLWDYS